ncbi:MAG: cobalamin biosynthesis protein CobD [Clostridia bacterium]|nr:cobalamin biosynthesis protein CobD [Clostridia bacterium]
MNRLFIPALLGGFLLDLLLGDPEWLYHPVRLIGRFISFAEARLRARMGNLFLAGAILTFLTVSLTMLTSALILFLLRCLGPVPCFIGMVLLDWMGLAARSMCTEARHVQAALEQSLESGRRQLSRIVGRDTDSLSEEEIIKATVETVAENTTDGVISPMFYAALGGPILLWGFKAASTLDSMVGYRNEKYLQLGCCSARLDDVLNFSPARLTGLMMALSAFPAGLDGANAFRIFLRDHARHPSPNSACGESAAAGALHIQLGGTHTYFGRPQFKPTIGDADRPARRGDIHSTCHLLLFTAFFFLTCLLILYFFLTR